MKATFSVVLVLAVSAWTSFAIDFPLPMSDHMTEELFQETKALCNKNVKGCWMLSYFNPSEPICASDHVTYGGECHLCSGILIRGSCVSQELGAEARNPNCRDRRHEDKTIIKMHDGECVYSDKTEQD